MQIVTGSPNFSRFGFSAKFKTDERLIVFNIDPETVFTGSGNLNVQGICFSVVDQAGIALLEYDWTNPQIPLPSTNASPVYLGTSTYTLDIGFWAYNFLFQKYKIKGAIKDANGTIYEVVFPVKNVTIPKGFTDYGTVEGTFDVKADCTNSILTVKETTLFDYKDTEAISTITNGILNYPLGTIADVPFTFTPFSNNKVYTGTYKVTNTTVATYDLGDGFYVTINYATCSEWSFNCEKHMVDLMCCIEGLVREKEEHCNNPIGARAAQKLKEAEGYIMVGFIKEYSGQDASFEAAKIKKLLNCNCGKGAIRHVQPNPVNPTIYNIVITGAGGTSVTPSTAGNTKSYVVKSNSYEVGKYDQNDLAFNIYVDTTSPNIVKYLLKFDYAVLSSYIAASLQVNNGISYDVATKYIQLGGSLVKDTDIAIGSKFLSVTAASTLFKVIAGTITATVQNILLGLFASNRDDTGTYAPINFLYTDASGKLQSSPLLIRNGITKLLAGIIELGGALTKDTTIDFATFFLTLIGRTYMNGKLGVGIDNTTANFAKAFFYTTADTAASYSYNAQQLSNTTEPIGAWATALLNGGAFSQSVEQGAYGAFCALYMQQTGNQSIISDAVSGITATLNLSIINASTVSAPMLSAIRAGLNITDDANYEQVSLVFVSKPDSKSYQGRPTFTGTIDDLHGIYIDDQYNSDVRPKVTGKVYAIRQIGLLDVNYFAAKLTMNATIASTTGAQTIDKPCGQIQIAAAGRTCVVTNALVTTNSLIFVTLVADDTTATSAYVSAQSAGSFTIKLNAACTSQIKVNFEVKEVG